jgi:hypothetical protein
MLRRTSVIGSRQGRRSAKQSGQKLAPKTLCKILCCQIQEMVDSGSSRHLAEVLVAGFWITGNPEVVYAASGLGIGKRCVQRRLA